MRFKFKKRRLVPNSIIGLFRQESGQTLVEYGLVLLLVVVVITAVLTLLGQNVLTLLQNVVASF